MSAQRTVFDTGPIVAALDRADRYHDACVDLIATTPGVLLLPVPVIVEAAQHNHREASSCPALTRSEVPGTVTSSRSRRSAPTSASAAARSTSGG
jgi:hypothetical protein